MGSNPCTPFHDDKLRGVVGRNMRGGGGRGRYLGRGGGDSGRRGAVAGGEGSCPLPQRGGVRRGAGQGRAGRGRGQERPGGDRGGGGRAEAADACVCCERASLAAQEQERAHSAMYGVGFRLEGRGHPRVDGRVWADGKAGQVPSNVLLCCHCSSCRCD